MVSPKDIHIRSLELVNITLFGKRGFASVIKLKILKKKETKEKEKELFLDYPYGPKMQSHVHLKDVHRGDRNMEEKHGGEDGSRLIGVLPSQARRTRAATKGGRDRKDFPLQHLEGAQRCQILDF